MTARRDALVRLLAVQASWTYERMSGIGVGHAALPLLRDLFANRTVRERREAVARSAEFFNSHPYLAGIAVGAIVRAERDGVPGEVILRLRTALAGPLGALGDQLVWAGEVPLLMGLALATAPWLGIWSVIGAVVMHNLFRLRLTVWGLDLGLREGLGVGAALNRSWLPRGAAEAQRVAAFAVGLAVPIVAWCLLRGATRNVTVGTLMVALAGTVLTLAPATRTRVTGFKLGLVLLAVALLIAGVVK